MIKRKTCIEEGCAQPVWARKRCKYHDSIHHPKKHGILKPSGETSPERVQPPKKKKRIAPVSAKQAARLREYRKLRDEYMSLHTKCEVRGCNRPSEDLHHGAGRLGDLLTDVRYFKALCREHHRWVEENPTEAKEVGLSFNRLDK